MKKLLCLFLFCSSLSFGQYRFGDRNPWADSTWFKFVDFQPTTAQGVVRVIFDSQNGYPYILFYDSGPPDSFRMQLGAVGGMAIVPGHIDLSAGNPAYGGALGHFWFDENGNGRLGTTPAGNLGYVDVTYKQYKATLTQAAGGAPTATVGINTFGGTIVWTRASTGDYRGTLSGAFPTAGKVWNFASPQLPNANMQVIILRFDSNTIRVLTYDGSNVLSDDKLSNTSIYFEVFK